MNILRSLFFWRSRGAVIWYLFSAQLQQKDSSNMFTLHSVDATCMKKHKQYYIHISTRKM